MPSPPPSSTTHPPPSAEASAVQLFKSVEVNCVAVNKFDKVGIVEKPSVCDVNEMKAEIIISPPCDMVGVSEFEIATVAPRVDACIDDVTDICESTAIVAFADKYV